MAKRRKKQEIIDALEKTGGLVTHAAKELGMAREALHRYISRHEDLKELLEKIRDSNIDRMEAALIEKALNQKDLGAICFYLKCQGKKRGWVEKQQVEISQQDDIEITVNVIRNETKKETD